MDKNLQPTNCPDCGGKLIHNKQEKRMKCEYCPYYTGIVKGEEIYREIVHSKKLLKFNGESTEKSVLHENKINNGRRTELK
jgi:hypothetical protein